RQTQTQKITRTQALPGHALPPRPASRRETQSLRTRIHTEPSHELDAANRRLVDRFSRRCDGVAPRRAYRGALDPAARAPHGAGLGDDRRAVAARGLLRRAGLAANRARRFTGSGNRTHDDAN